MNENKPEQEEVQQDAHVVVVPAMAVDIGDADGVDDTDTEMSSDAMELAALDPMAALLSNMPHKARAIAELVFKSGKDDLLRQERSDVEASKNMPARTIQRSLKAQMRFLRGKFYQPGVGTREQTRRLRQQQARGK
jgi:hypothetical protein